MHTPWLNPSLLPLNLRLTVPLSPLEPSRTPLHPLGAHARTPHARDVWCSAAVVCSGKCLRGLCQVAFAVQDPKKKKRERSFVRHTMNGKGMVQCLLNHIKTVSDLPVICHSARKVRRWTICGATCAFPLQEPKACRPRRNTYHEGRRATAEA